MKVQSSYQNNGTLHQRYSKNIVTMLTMTICRCEGRIVSPKAEMTEAEPKSKALKLEKLRWIIFMMSLEVVSNVADSHF